MTCVIEEDAALAATTPQYRTRVLLVNGNFADDTVGGTQSATRNLAGALTGAGHEVAVLCQGQRGTVERGGQLCVYRLRPPHISRATGSRPVRFLNQCLAIHNPFVARQVRAVLDDFSPHLCHVQMLRRLTPTVVSVLAERPEIALVQTVHELFSLWNFNAFQYKDSPDKIYTDRPRIVDVFKQRHRRLSATVDHVCAPSEFALGAYRDDGYFTSVPASVFRLGVPFEWGDPVEVAAARHAEVARATTTSFLFIGRLDFYKGVELLLQAMAALPHADLRLHIVGAGPMEPAVREHAAHDPRVVFHGPVEGDRRRVLFRGADAVVCPSTWVETFGLVVAEAYACALPVIAARAGSLADLVEHCATGLVISRGSAGELSSAMLALRDPARRLAMANSAAAAAEAFDLDSFTERQLDVYRAALARRANCRDGGPRQ